MESLGKKTGVGCRISFMSYSLSDVTRYGRDIS
jgi:hypothetical protein